MRADVVRAGALVLLVLGAGCAKKIGPPPIADDAVCARCEMDAGNRRFACERLDQDKWLVYDSIECLRGDAPTAAATTVWLADYDRKTLHRADSMWVVSGALTTPMGGGLAAFLDRASADTVANVAHGTVMRWDEIATHGRTP